MVFDGFGYIFTKNFCPSTVVGAVVVVIVVVVVVVVAMVVVAIVVVVVVAVVAVAVVAVAVVVVVVTSGPQRGFLTAQATPRPSVGVLSLHQTKFTC